MPSAALPACRKLHAAGRGSLPGAEFVIDPTATPMVLALCRGSISTEVFFRREAIGILRNYGVEVAERPTPAVPGWESETPCTRIEPLVPGAFFPEDAKFLRVGRVEPTRRKTALGHEGTPISGSMLVIPGSPPFTVTDWLNTDTISPWQGLVVRRDLAADLLRLSNELGLLAPHFEPMSTQAVATSASTVPAKKRGKPTKQVATSPRPSKPLVDLIRTLRASADTSFLSVGGEAVDPDSPLASLSGAVLFAGGLVVFPRTDRPAAARDALNSRGLFEWTADEANERCAEVCGPHGIRILGQRGGTLDFFGVDSGGRVWLVDGHDGETGYPVALDFSDWFLSVARIITATQLQPEWKSRYFS